MFARRPEAATRATAWDVRAYCAAAIALSLLGLALPTARAGTCQSEWTNQFPAGTFNGIVWALTVFDDGTGPALYAGGAFTTAGGVSANSIAKWDGNTWSPLGAGMVGTVFTLAVFDDDGPGPNPPALYAAGNFVSAGGFPANYIAKWNGSFWIPLGYGMNSTVYALTAFDADGGGPGLPVLAAGGFFTVAGGKSASRIASWDGTAWSPLGSGIVIDNSVMALAAFDDDGDGPNPPALYAGGAFITIGGATSFAHHVAKWDGAAWSPLRVGTLEADGVSSTVWAMTVFDDDGPGPHAPALYLGGQFTEAGGTAAAHRIVNRIVKWDGANWTALGSGANIGLNGPVWSLGIFDADADGSGLPALYVGGLFTTAGGGSASNIARWDGTAWSALGSGTNDGVRSLVGAGPYQPALYAAGDFTTAGGVPSEHLARWGCPLNASPPVVGRSPKSQSVCGGARVTFDVSAWGTPPLTYQWRKNATPIDDANTPVYTIDAAGPDDAGAYDVVITNAFGTATSSAATLTLGTLRIVQQLESQTECTGSAVTLSIMATGLEPITYLWRRDGLPLYWSGTHHTIDPVDPNYAGVYTVIVSNACQDITSEPATLIVGSHPELVDQPQSQSICVGASATFSVSAMGVPPLAYQWRKDGQVIPDANAPMFTIDAVEPNDAGTYTVDVWDFCAPSSSEPAMLTVSPTIGTPPQSQAACAGGSASFTVTATGTPGPNYQWRKGTTNLTNGGNITGATTATLTIDPIAAGDAATNYNCVVTDTCGSATSSDAALTVNVAAAIAGQPGNQMVCSGGSVSFTVTATGTPAPTYQWRKVTTNLVDGGNISGATTATLTINPAGAGDAATTYNCVVTNSCGSEASHNATLTVNTAAAVTGQPGNQTVCSSSSASFTVTATGTPAPTYQWRKGTTNLTNAGNISGATTATLTINPAAAGDAAADYNCVVTNTCGTATSNNSSLTVNAGAGVIEQPSDQAVCVGGSASFTVSANGTPAPTYQWRKGLTNLTNGGRISGATTASLTINPVGTGDAATNYNCVVTNSCGAVTSNDAKLTVNTAAAVTGQPSGQTVCSGRSASFTVTATGTPAPTYQWRKGTTNLTDGGRISGATTRTLTINPVDPNYVATDYNCVVTNTCGSATSDNASLTVNGATISGQPGNQTVCAGSSASFNVVATGTPAPTYQWRRGATNLANGGNISGATTATLTINPAGTGDAAADYNCIVTNTCGQTPSGNAALVVNSGPAITEQPADQPTCTLRLAATFHVTATGSPSPTYQWRRGTTSLVDGGNIAGATSAALTIDPVDPNDAATNYNCVVTNNCGSATSNSAALILNAGPAITAQPAASQAVCSGGTASFSISAHSSPAPTYQWRKGTTNLANGGNLSGATAAMLTINPVGAGDASSDYNCVVTNACGPITSDSAALTVKAGVEIQEQPQSQSACAGTAITFRVSAGGSAALTYQWRRNGQDIAGARAASYDVNSVTAELSGQYDVVIVDTCGTVTSAAAMLTVQDCPPALAAPTEPVPPDGATSLPAVLELQWAGVAGATMYEVRFGSTATPPPVGSTAAPRWTVSELTAGARYYWRVVAKNGTAATDGPLWSFTTAPAVPPPGGGNQDPPGGAEPNNPDPGGNGDVTDPNQNPTDPSGDVTRDPLLPPQCGASPCGAGTLGMLPLMVLCLGGLKLHRRRQGGRGRPGAGTPLSR